MDDDDERMDAAPSAPLLGHPPSRSDVLSDEVVTLQRAITAAVQWSLVANVALLLAKVVALVVTGSMAVAASTLDSLVDLASQGIVALADSTMSKPTRRYPAGMARLEPLAVIACAAVMMAGAAEVIRASVLQLISGLRGGDLPDICMTPLMYAILGAATFIKLVLYLYCVRLRQHSGAALALAEDHLNDVVSNAGAVITAAAASSRRSLWWTDPAGGVIISLYIVFAWIRITVHQVRKIVGVTAPDEITAELKTLAREHHPGCRLSFLRAYHSGQRLQVDCELEGPPEMTVAAASQIALHLKKILEAVEEVESAAVVVVRDPDASRRARERSANRISPLGRKTSQPMPTYSPHGSADLMLLGTSMSVPVGSPELATYGQWRHTVSDGKAAAATTSGDEESGSIWEGVRPGASTFTDAGERVGNLLPQHATRSGLAGQLLWSRSLRDPPDWALRSASLVGGGTTRAASPEEE